MLTTDLISGIKIITHSKNTPTLKWGNWKCKNANWLPGFRTDYFTTLLKQTNKQPYNHILCCKEQNLWCYTLERLTFKSFFKTRRNFLNDYICFYFVSKVLILLLCYETLTKGRRNLFMAKFGCYFKQVTHTHTHTHTHPLSAWTTVCSCNLCRSTGWNCEWKRTERWDRDLPVVAQWL